MPVRVVRLVPAQKSSAALLYVASDGEDDAYVSTLLLRGLNVPDTFLRMTVFPRGIGAVPWDKTFWKATLRNAMQVGETVDSMRITDVRAAIELLAGADAATEITVVGKGVSGALGLYAAIYNPKVTHVVLIDPPVSHAEGPILLNVMRYTDLPEAAALFAPRRLTFYGRMPAAYEYTQTRVAALWKNGSVRNHGAGKVVKSGAGNPARSRLLAGPRDKTGPHKSRLKGGCSQEWLPHYNSFTAATTRSISSIEL